MAGRYEESKHPRGQPENAGQFGPGGGGAKSKTADKKRRGVGHEHARQSKTITTKQAASEGAPLKLRKPPPG